MGASRFVGRVGGLAVALGIGGAMFAGVGVAWADSADQASPDRGTSAAASAHGPRVGVKAATSPKVSNRQQRNTIQDSAAPSAALPVSAVKVPTSAVRAVTPRPAASIVASATAAATSSQSVTKDGLTVDPTVNFADGIFFGTLNATSSRGATLTYESLGGANGGKLALGTGPSDPTAQDFTALPYATWLDAGSQAPAGTEQFRVRVSEVTGLDQFLIDIPLVGLIAKPVIGLLQQLPLISTLLAPLIGASLVAAVEVNAGAVGSNPIAYTYDVTSFDGTPISMNFFPSVAVANGDVATAATVLNGPGLASPGQTNPYAEWGITNQTLGVGSLRTAVVATEAEPDALGYNVVTWDPRGEFASGGMLQLDNPFYEGRDVSALVDFIAGQTPAALDGAGDPTVGMVGGSYGGGIQLTAASTDSRIDAIVPDISWNSLNSALYPSDSAFRTAYGSLLLLSLITTGARINPQIYNGVLVGDLLGWMSQRSQAVLASSGPTSLLNQLQAATMLTQGTVDVLFPLQQSLDNIQTILANPYGTDTRLTWFCGGHGVCADFTSDSPQGQAQAALLKSDALAWLDKFLIDGGVGPTAADLIPNFQWFDQLGGYNSSNLLPYETGFNNLPDITGTNAGGLLGILPLIGGSGPGAGTLPYSLGNGSPAGNAINIDLTVPTGTQVVGAPTVSFTYTGLGTSRALYAQVIDESTGRVLGNIVTPVPVTLDGHEHQVTIDLANIAYSYGGATNAGQLTLQITTSATAFANLTAFGLINISDITVTLPNRNPQPEQQSQEEA